jgi:hypothetical protein
MKFIKETSFECQLMQRHQIRFTTTLIASFDINYDVVPYTQVNSADESVVKDLCELHGMDYESLFGPFESECNSKTLGTNMATCVESSTTEFNIVTCVNAANPSDRCSMFPLKTNIFSQLPVLSSDKCFDPSTDITAHLQNSATLFLAAPVINKYSGYRRYFKEPPVDSQSKSTVGDMRMICDIRSIELNDEEGDSDDYVDLFCYYEYPNLSSPKKAMSRQHRKSKKSKDKHLGTNPLRIPPKKPNAKRQRKASASLKSFAEAHILESPASLIHSHIKTSGA